jgi:hypothetical protein
MNTVTRFLNNRSTPGRPLPGYYIPFKINFGDGRVASAVRVPYNTNMSFLLNALHMQARTPVLFVSGGAGLMTDQQMGWTRDAVLDGLAQFAADYGVTVVDGGTQAGVMQLLGEAQRQGGHKFPLIGVAPLGAVQFPGYDNPDGVPLDPDHSHFVLAEGTKFGDESNLIVRLALALNSGRATPPFGVVINGGGVTTQETYDRSLSPETALPLLVFDGSGRFSDTLAAAAQGVHNDDPRISTILKNVDVRVVPLDFGPSRVYAELQRLLS